MFNDLILDGNADGAFELVEGDLVAVWLALVVDCVHLPMIPPPPALNNGAHDGPEMLAQRCATGGEVGTIPRGRLGDGAACRRTGCRSSPAMRIAGCAFWDSLVA